MAPNVTVPMNFGRHLLGSPTHSTLKLNTSEGGEVRASSIILSFNSPVIDHMTTTLHMTSVDMLEFGEAAVRLFVDASYSGTSEGISQETFREINKMANVFKVTWLVEKCAEYFRGAVDSVKTPSYSDLLYLFEEAAFVCEKLKSKDFLKLSIKKIEMLKWKEQFIDKYLENADRLSTQKLDLVIELAGSEVECVVQKLTRQLSELVLEQGLPGYCEYLLENSDLSLCRESNRVLFDRLFDVLDSLPDDRMRWTYTLLKKFTKKSMAVTELDGPSTSVSSSTSSSRSNLIPNMYHSFNMNMSLDEVFEWLSVSGEVNNLMMALEAVLMWNWYQVKLLGSKDFIYIDVIENKIGKVCDHRGWSKLPPSFRNCYLAVLRTFFSFYKIPVTLTSSPLTQDTVYSIASQLPQGGIKGSITSVLSTDTTLKFQFKHPSVTSCKLAGQCGFILKTVPSELPLWNLRLCTEEEDYIDEPVHFHEEIRAENMHIVHMRAGRGKLFLCPLSWLGWLQKKDTPYRKFYEFSNKTVNPVFGSTTRFEVLYRL